MTPDNQLRRTPATTETHCQVKCILIQLSQRYFAHATGVSPMRISHVTLGTSPS